MRYFYRLFLFGEEIYFTCPGFISERGCCQHSHFIFLGDPGSIPGLGRSAGEGIPRLPTPVFLSFPGGSAGKESTCNVGDVGSVPESGRSSGEVNGYPLCYSGLENSMGCTGVAKSRAQLSDFHFYFQGDLIDVYIRKGSSPSG